MRQFCKIPIANSHSDHYINKSIIFILESIPVFVIVSIGHSSSRIEGPDIRIVESNITAFHVLHIKGEGVGTVDESLPSNY